MDDGRPVKVSGNKHSPTYHGFCCTRGQATPEQMGHPDRLLHSLKRVSEGHYEPIASESLMDEVAMKIRALVDRHGAACVAVYIGTFAVPYPVGMNLALAWAQALGTPMFFSSSTIDQPGKDIANALLGTWEAGMQSFTGADTWLMIGANPLLSLSAGMPVQNTGFLMTEAISLGMKLIVIDPRRTQTAKRAAIHLQPRPGEDATILAGMIRLILAENLYDRDFVREDVIGLDSLRSAVEPFTVEYVARRADIPESLLIEATRVFTSARRGIATGGTGANMSGHSSLTEYLIQCLNAICGRFIRANEAVPNPGVLVPRAMPRAQARPPRPATFEQFALPVRGLTLSAAGMPTAACADEMLAGKIKVLISLGGNPVAAWPDQNRTLAGIENLDLFVQIDIKMSASAKVAHYVVAPKVSFEVPTASLNENYESATTFWGFVEPYGMYAPRLMDAPADSDVIEEWEFFYGLAQRLGMALTLSPIDATAATRRAPKSAVSIDMANKPTTDQLLELITTDSRIPLAELKNHPNGAVFPEDIRAEPKEVGWPHKLNVGAPEMMAELREVTVERASVGAEFPYRMIGRRVAHAYNSSARDLPSMIRKGGTYNPAYMHPADLSELGLAPGDVVEVTSEHGTIPAIVEADETLRRGLVSIAHAFGDLPKDRERFRAVGSNTSQLTSVEHDFDRFSGIPRMSSVPVRVTSRRDGMNP
jgi:anaerobic selenocysteine-containing dehydrogenase